MPVQVKAKMSVPVEASDVKPLSDLCLLFAQVPDAAAVQQLLKSRGPSETPCLRAAVDGCRQRAAQQGPGLGTD